MKKFIVIEIQKLGLPFYHEKTKVFASMDEAGSFVEERFNKEESEAEAHKERIESECSPYNGGQSYVKWIETGDFIFWLVDEIEV